MPTFSKMELAVLSVATCFFALFFFLSLLSSYQWYKVADSFWMKPRWAKWQIYTLSITWVCYVAVRCSTMWFRIWVKDPDNVDDTFARKGIYIPTLAGNLIAILLWLVPVYTRLWLSYFDANLCMELKALEWKQLIDTRQRDDNDNWFVANQNTWGNPSFVLKVISLPTILLLAIVAFVTFFFNAFVTILYAFIVISFLAIWVLFAKKYPAFRDGIHLREEAHCIKWVATLYAVGYVIGSIAFFFVKAKDDSVAYVLTVCSRQITGALFCVAFQLTTVNYVSSFFAQPSLVVCGVPLIFAKEKESDKHTRSVSNALSAAHVLTIGDTRITLWSVLRHDIGCRLLMSHLLSELSHENLLALIECVKFRERMAVVCGVQLEASDKIRAANLFGSEVNDTQSSIVAALQSPSDAPPVYAALCRKYVADTSPNVLNMSYAKRRFALALMNSGELDSFSLDPIIRECLVLLRDCYSRFYHIEKCAKFVEEYGDELS